MEKELRWNYSPLKEKAAHVAGRPFRLKTVLGSRFSVLSESVKNGLRSSVVPRF